MEEGFAGAWKQFLPDTFLMSPAIYMGDRRTQIQVLQWNAIFLITKPWLFNTEWMNEWVWLTSDQQHIRLLDCLDCYWPIKLIATKSMQENEYLRKQTGVNDNT